MSQALLRTFPKVLAMALTLSMGLYPIAMAETKEVTLPIGTRIPISVYNTVSSNNLKEGDMIATVINQDIVVEGVTVFKHGANGILNVTKAIPSGGHGRAGLLEVSGGRVIDVQGKDHPVNLSITQKGISRRGWGITASIIGVLIILVPFGIWVNGTPATLQGGAVYEALTTAPITLNQVSADVKGQITP